MKFPVPANETERLRVLRELQDVSQPADGAFDTLTALAAKICGAPAAFLTVVEEDRQWFRAWTCVVRSA